MLFGKICKLVTIFVYLDNKKAVFLGITHKAVSYTHLTLPTKA